MGQETRTFNVTIDSDIKTRGGVVSDIALFATKDGISRIDFLIGDIPDGDDSIRAALVSRVFMSNKDLLSFRDNLNEFIDNNVDPKVRGGNE